jgi:hypothetical protein
MPILAVCAVAAWGQYRRIAEIEFGAAYCTKADFTFAQSVRAKLKEKLLANRIVFQLYQR